ncbi:hypothetical protein OROHE_016870 [Orobanche hederae]
MNKDSLNDSSKVPSLSNILHNSIIIHLDRTIGQDGNVQFCCGLKLTEITSLAANQVQRLPTKTTKEHGSHLKSVPVSYNNLGPPLYECPTCAAMMWYEERTNKARRSKNLTFSLCCQDGKVFLSKFSETPPPLNKVLDYTHAATSKFRDQIRVYNSMFCFTSFGAKIDHSINTECANNSLRLLGQRTTSTQYNMPSVSEVAALITNDFSEGVASRDIIVNNKDTGPRRIS